MAVDAPRNVIVTLIMHQVVTQKMAHVYANLDTRETDAKMVRSIMSVRGGEAGGEGGVCDPEDGSCKCKPGHQGNRWPYGKTNNVC